MLEKIANILSISSFLKNSRIIIFANIDLLYNVKHENLLFNYEFEVKVFKWNLVRYFVPFYKKVRSTGSIAFIVPKKEKNAIELLSDINTIFVKDSVFRFNFIKYDNFFIKLKTLKKIILYNKYSLSEIYIKITYLYLFKLCYKYILFSKYFFNIFLKYLIIKVN